MIFAFIFNVLLGIINFFLSALPQVTELPLGIDAYLVTAVGYWYAFLEVFWPMQIVWTLFLWYVAIQAVLIIARFFLPNRIPNI